MKNDTFYEPVAVAEKTIEINLINKASGVYFPCVPVYEGNTLGQILEEYAEDLGLDIHAGKYIFENRSNGLSTSDILVTVRDFGLQDGGELVLLDEGGVAGTGWSHSSKACRSTTVRRHRQREIREGDFSLTSQDVCAPSQTS